MPETTHAKHPPYLGIWGVLFVLTVFEVGVAFFQAWPKAVIIVVLMFLAGWKALLVALYYMHLRFEGTRLRILAIAPLPLAIILIAAVVTEYLW